jgi:3-hydroxyisobutyrate dehydrogenase-like beta-hydroxyacid dehydrogenase
MSEVVGVVGLGAIGGHIARAVARSRRVVGYDVREGAYAEFPEAERMPSPRHLAEAADIVLVAVFDGAQLRDALTGEDGILGAGAKPAVICVLSTINLDTLQWAAERASAAGVELVDCGVTGSAGLRTHGTIVVLAGGSEAAIALARPTLDLFAAPLLHMGPLGAGMQTKLACNLTIYSGWYAAWEAARVAAAAGIDIDKLVEAHTVSTQSSSGPTSLLSQGIGPGPGDPADEASTPLRRALADFATKDLGYVLQLARELDLELPGAALVRDRIESVVGLE